MRSNRIGPIMQCPVCGEDCVQKARDLVENLETVFAPCGECRGTILDKTRPPPDQAVARPCPCGKRFIDDVFVHLYGIMVEEGILSRDDPLKKVGMPLVHPGFAMEGPPYLPSNSLLLLSTMVDKPVAKRIHGEVPEIRGVVKCGSFVPGAVDVDLTSETPRTYELLAGCDVRADVFYTQHSPVVVYKQQSLIHIEFPRGYDPKIVNVGIHLRHSLPRAFVDASCGAGTLGIIAAQYGVPHVIMNDAWYAAAFWAAFNLSVNAESFPAGEIHILEDYASMASHPVSREPRRIAYTEGKQLIEVYQGDFRNLPPLIPERDQVVTVIDLFEKGDQELNERIKRDWRDRVGGEVFIP